MNRKMKIIKNDDFLNFVDSLLKDDSRTVVGVKSKGEKFVFDELDSAEELRLDYNVTVMPPKKYFSLPNEKLIEYDISDYSLKTAHEYCSVIIIGVHPYDIAAIRQMDIVHKDKYEDIHYIERRENSVLIGVNIQNVSPHAFAGSMGTDTVDDGYDLMLTILGDMNAIEIGTEKGKKLLEKYEKITDADDKTISEVQCIKKGIVSKFKKQLTFPSEELPKLMGKNYDNPIWEEKSRKCFSCGSCNLVCPTCFCFDTQDLIELNLEKGLRTRTWDGCLLEDFARVATGENFRKTRRERYRHRFMRKGSYLYKRYGFIACVGCGRCSSVCLPDIADPVVIFNRLKEGST